MRPKTDAILIPLDILTQSEFCQLRITTRDESPALLGRLVALALSVYATRRVKLHVAEIDAIVDWRSRGSSFASHLARVGWCRLDAATHSIGEVTLPPSMQRFHRYALNGKKRAASAKRDALGRYLPSPTRKSRERRPTATLDVDGKTTAKTKPAKPAEADQK